MLRIRLSRVGKKKQPHYRIVVMDQRRPRDSRYVEVVGHWLGQGAQPTETVRSFLRRHKLVS